MQTVVRLDSFPDQIPVEERNNGMIALYYLPDVKPYPVLFLQNQQRIYKVRKAVQAQFRSVQALHAKRFAYYG